MKDGLIDASQIFEYPAGTETVQAWNGFEEPGSSDSANLSLHSHESADSTLQIEKKVAEEARRSVEAGVQRGIAEGRKLERDAAASAAVTQQNLRLEQSARLLQGFADARDQYLRSVEQEVVQLALAVAARILRREAQMDPLLLTGAVRVALGQLAQSTEVRLRVPRSELELWKEAIVHLPNLPLRPSVEAGEEMRLGDCVVETSLGSVDLGVRAQLSEIERGFFDRTGHTENARSGSAAARAPSEAEVLP